MKLIGHREAFELTLKFLRPEIKRQSFGLIAPEGLGRVIFTKVLFEAVTGASSASSDFRLQDKLGVNDMRDVQEWASSLPVHSKFKFLVVVPCDQLTEEAQQALLKLLEEPPPYLIMILAGDVEALARPIYSRLALIRLKHLIRSDCDAIWASLGIEQSMNTNLWGLAPGQPGLALPRLTQGYPALLLAWGKFLQNKPSSIGLLHWQDQLSKEWTIKDHYQLWLWLMPQTLKAYKDPSCPICIFSQKVVDALSLNPDVSPRLLIPALWHESIEIT